MDPCARNCCPGANAEAPPPRASAVDEAAKAKPTTAAITEIFVIVSSSTCSSSSSPPLRQLSGAVHGRYEKRLETRFVQIGQAPVQRSTSVCRNSPLAGRGNAVARDGVGSPAPPRELTSTTCRRQV